MEDETDPTTERDSGSTVAFFPARVGRYELIGRIGAGGMASLFLGRVTGPGKFEKRVVIKFLHPHLADDQDMIEMFLDEAALAARINHPNVCSVIDFGQIDRGYFIAMEHLVGATLSSTLNRLSERQRSPKDLALLCRVLADAAAGLHAAHHDSGRRWGAAARGAS